jgi:hypothetical protein
MALKNSKQRAAPGKRMSARKGCSVPESQNYVHSYPCNEERIVRCGEFPSSSTRRFVGILSSLR